MNWTEAVEAMKRGAFLDGAFYALRLAARPLTASPTAPSTEASEPVRDKQSAFEDWLYRACPSGDVTEVQRQWEASSDFAEWSAEARASKGTPL